MHAPCLQDLLLKKIAKKNKVDDKDYICVCSKYGVIVTYARLHLPQTNILSRKVEPTRLLGIRTILLVWHLLIYLKIIISKYCKYIDDHSEILLYVTANPRTTLGCTTRKSYALVHSHTSTNNMAAKRFRSHISTRVPLLYRHVLEYSTI